MAKDDKEAKEEAREKKWMTKESEKTNFKTKKSKKSKKPTATLRKATSLVRLGSPEAYYDMDVDMNTDLPAPTLQTGMIEALDPNHAATKITSTSGVLGIATVAAVGLYLYKKKRRIENKNTEMEKEHSESVPAMEDVV